MKKKILAGTLAVGAFVSSFAAQSKPVHAMSVTCTPSVQSLVSPLDTNNPSDGCEVGTQNNDTVGQGVLQVNTDEFFGVNDWLFAGKDDDGGLLQDEIGVNFNPGNSTSGTWNIAGVVEPEWTDVMLVLKGSGDYVGYLLGGTQGDWESPFTNRNGNRQAVSHMSLYYREGSEPIPTPALLPGLIGMGVAAMKKRRGDSSNTADS